VDTGPDRPPVSVFDHGVLASVLRWQGLNGLGIGGSASRGRIEATRRLASVTARSKFARVKNQDSAETACLFLDASTTEDSLHE